MFGLFGYGTSDVGALSKATLPDSQPLWGKVPESFLRLLRRRMSRKSIGTIGAANIQIFGACLADIEEKIDQLGSRKRSRAPD